MVNERTEADDGTQNNHGGGELAVRDHFDAPSKEELHSC